MHYSSHMMGEIERERKSHMLKASASAPRFSHGDKASLNEEGVSSIRVVTAAKHQLHAHSR